MKGIHSTFRVVVIETDLLKVGLLGVSGLRIPEGAVGEGRATIEF